MSLSIVFMGTPEFAIPALKSLIYSDHDVVAVYSQPPRPAGRGMQLKASPVHTLADAHHIPVFTPANFKAEAALLELKSHKADIAVVVAYGLLLPKAVLTAFPKGCINIHPSALPRFRGAAPIQRTVLAGDATTDICIMQMDEGLDTGDVLARKTLIVPAEITSGGLHDTLAKDSAPVLLETLAAIERGTATRTPQSSEGVTYAQKISKDEARIDWTQPAEAILRKIRGLNPFPIATTKYEGETLKIHAGLLLETTSRGTAGAILDDALAIQCGEGSLRLTTLQRAGKAPMHAEEFLRGFVIEKSAMLS